MVGVGLFWGKFFLRSNFFHEEFYPPLYTFLWEDLSIYFRKPYQC